MPTRPPHSTTTVPTGTLRLLVGTSVASLGLNAAVAYVVLRQRPVWVAASPTPAAAPATAPPTIVIAPPAAGPAPAATTSGAAPEPAPVAVAAAPFVREYQYRDKATGQLRGAALLDDSARLERFVEAAHLTPEQERRLRATFAGRRQQEMALAQRMAKDGAWDGTELRLLRERFWAQAFHDLPPEQAATLPPEFFPVPAATGAK